MTGKKKTPTETVDEGIAAAEAAAKAEAEHRKTLEKYEAERIEAEQQEKVRRELEAKARRAIAVVDAEGVLIGRVDGPTEEQWAKAKPECRFPTGFDNALHRYRLVMWRPDRWRFEPVTHAKDAAEENLEGSPKILAPLARAVVALASAQTPAAGDVGKLVDYLKTFDAKGN